VHRWTQGLPSVKGLTEELRKRLPELCDVEGKPSPEFAELFDALAEHDTDNEEYKKYNVKDNYEQFFEWLVFLYRCQYEPFNRVARLNLDPRLKNAAVRLRWVVKRPIVDILRLKHQAATDPPDYLAKLGDFIPERSRLKVFTTNYDLCVEDACRAKGINVITGFETGRWNPSVFREGDTRGISTSSTDRSIGFTTQAHNISVRNVWANIIRPNGTGCPN
jgi:hypothetical protein